MHLVYSEHEKNCTVPTKREEMKTLNHVEKENDDHNLIDDLDLSGLTAQQQVVARQMLEKEKESFSKHDDDIGCIEELQLKLSMEDQTPVQKTYNSIPRPLYPEVKQHVEDLLEIRVRSNPSPKGMI